MIHPADVAGCGDEEVLASGWPAPGFDIREPLTGIFRLTRPWLRLLRCALHRQHGSYGIP